MRIFLSLLLLTATAAADTPVGEVFKFTFDKSKVFPGTTREVWVYVPKQYDGTKPACLHVNQDGIQYNAVKLDKGGKPIEGGAFDKLIAEKKMPVTIGVFVRPGVVKAILPNAADRINRSFEYDSLGGDYAKFLIHELLPYVETLSTGDGRKIKLSKDPNDRAIAGASSGGICAFTVAWERPDSFRRVFSSIGSYSDLRGGNVYPNLIRKFEPKPIRIFLEDGSGDLNNYAGDWWQANQQMERSLKFMGYEVEHNWGTGGHNGTHATEIFPDAMAWLWKDWPQPVKTGECQNDYLKQLLIPGEAWKVVGEGYVNLGGIVSDARGQVYFSEAKPDGTYVITGDKIARWKIESEGSLIDFHCLGPAGKFYATKRGKDLPPRFAGQFNWIDDNGKCTEVKDEMSAASSVALHNGSVYFTPHDFLNPDKNNVFHLTATGIVTSVLQNPVDGPCALAVSADQSLLYFHDLHHCIVYCCQVGPIGQLNHAQKLVRLQITNSNGTSGGGMRCDREGRLWVATDSGLQLCDREGRVHCVIPTPNGKCNNLTFGGKEFDTLYVTAGDKVYSRKVKARAANAFEPPIALPKK